MPEAGAGVAAGACLDAGARPVRPLRLSSRPPRAWVRRLRILTRLPRAPAAACMGTPVVANGVAAARDGCRVHGFAGYGYWRSCSVRRLGLQHGLGFIGCGCRRGFGCRRGRGEARLRARAGRGGAIAAVNHQFPCENTLSACRDNACVRHPAISSFPVSVHSADLYFLGSAF